MSRTDLVLLAERILIEVDPARRDELIADFDRHVPHPAGSDLFLFPEITVGAEAPTAGEIVAAALAYEAAPLPAGRWRVRAGALAALTASAK